MISTDRVGEKLIWWLTLFYVVAFYVFYSMWWGKYLYLGIAIAIFLLTASRSNGVVCLPIKSFHLYVAVFAVYCLFSALWAWDASAAVSKFSTIASILLCQSLMYPYYSSCDSVKKLLDVLMWAGNAVAVYSIAFYGFDELYAATMSSSLRLDNAYNNVNSIGMLCAFALVIQFYKIVYDRITFSVVFAVPAVIVIAAMQSRKSILIIAVGCFMTLVFKNMGNEKIVRAIPRLVLTVVLFGVTAALLSRLRLFSGVNERIVSLLVTFTGEGKADGSSLLRATMRHIGMEQFRETPFFGIGIGSSGMLLQQRIGRNTYLHSNYVELLACGGLVGTVIYYLPLLSVGRELLKKGRIIQGETAICLILLTLLLMLDYGAVSYAQKSHYFYLMILFLQADRLRVQNRHNLEEKG